jgi:hypothetical protein
MGFIPLAVVAVAAVVQLQTTVLTGRVLDATDRPVPGATVRISGATVAASVVSDGMGRFRIGDLSDGPYVLTVSLAGFRTRTVDVRVEAPATPELVVKLTTGILIEWLWIVPQPADAYRMAAAVAHLRIDSTRPSGSCGDAQVVTAYHAASALRVFKGRVPPTIELHQEAAGRCRERFQWHEGIERPYRAGEEYVVFLAERGGGLGRLAGPSLAFPVHGGLVSLGGFAGVQGSISLDAFSELLDRLSRNGPPDRIAESKGHFEYNDPRLASLARGTRPDTRLANRSSFATLAAHLRASRYAGQPPPAS